MVVGSGRAAVERPEFRWVNTILGNIKNALRGTYHAIRPKYAQRYLSEFEYRFKSSASTCLTSSRDLSTRLLHKSWHVVVTQAPSVQRCESMAELSFESFVTVHRQDRFTGWANDAPGALNEGTAKGFDFAKAPQRGTFRRRAAGARRESHLEFAG